MLPILIFFFLLDKEIKSDSEDKRKEAYIWASSYLNDINHNGVPEFFFLVSRKKGCVTQAAVYWWTRWAFSHPEPDFVSFSILMRNLKVTLGEPLGSKQRLPFWFVLLPRRYSSFFFSRKLEFYYARVFSSQIVNLTSLQFLSLEKYELLIQKK